MVQRRKSSATPARRPIGKASTESIQKEIDGIGSYGEDFKSFVKKGVKQWKIPVGDNCIRYMPPLEDGVFFGLKIYVHFNIGSNKEQFLCMAQTFGEPCPICVKQKQIKNEGASDEDIKALYPSKKYVFWIVDMKNKEGGVQLFNCPKTIAESMLLCARDEDTSEPIDISDAEVGYNFFFTRTGTGMIDTKYTGFKIARKQSMLEDPDWLDAVTPLDDVLEIPSVDEMEKVIGTDTTAVPNKEDAENDVLPDEKEEKEFSRRGSAEVDVGEDSIKARLRQKLKDRGLA